MEAEKSIIRLVRENKAGEIGKDLASDSGMATFRVKQGGVAGAHRLSAGDLVIVGRKKAAGGLTVIRLAEGADEGEFTVLESRLLKEEAGAFEAEGVIVGFMRKLK